MISNVKAEQLTIYSNWGLCRDGS